MSIQTVPQNLPSTLTSPSPVATQIPGPADKVEKRFYRSVAPSMVYIFGNGKPCIFVRGRFSTDNSKEIAELDNEIALGHPHIRKMTEEEIAEHVTTPEDALLALREQIIAEYIATQPGRDMGTSAAGPVRPSNSDSVAVAMAGGSGKPHMSPALMALAMKALKKPVDVQNTAPVESAVKPLAELLPIMSTKVQEDDGSPRLTALLEGTAQI